jgi:CheY-like chemotaxis protein
MKVPTSNNPVLQQRPSANGEAASLRLLVVDDNVDAADTLALLLRQAGHQVRVAHTGAAAVQSALSCQPEVVLLDIGLPGMDGYQVAARLREVPQLKKTTVIAMTGYGEDSDRQRAFQAGFDHHFLKPIDPERLQDFLATLGKA